MQLPKNGLFLLVTILALISTGCSTTRMKSLTSSERFSNGSSGLANFSGGSFLHVSTITTSDYRLAVLRVRSCSALTASDMRI